MPVVLTAPFDSMCLFIHFHPLIFCISRFYQFYFSFIGSGKELCHNLILLWSLSSQSTAHFKEMLCELPLESVISVTGTVIPRPPGQANPVSWWLLHLQCHTKLILLVLFLLIFIPSQTKLNVYLLYQQCRSELPVTLTIKVHTSSEGSIV